MSATILPRGSGIRGFQHRDLGLKEQECLRTAGGWTLTFWPIYLERSLPSRNWVGVCVWEGVSL